MAETPSTSAPRLVVLLPEVLPVPVLEVMIEAMKEKETTFLKFEVTVIPHFFRMLWTQIVFGGSTDLTSTNDLLDPNEEGRALPICNSTNN
jgi:hypothetical protein